jgi:REP element-mobilizing transposase RayT
VNALMRSRYKVTPETNVYFITASTKQWVPILFNETIFQIILNSFKYCQANKGLRLHGYVIMINHLHAIISHDNYEDIPYVVRDFKRHTATEISRYLSNLGEFSQLSWVKLFHCQERGQHRVWQEGYHPVAIKSQAFFDEKLTYIHNNPVKKGFVNKPEDWKYSSARNYLLGDDRLIVIDKIT